MKIGSFNTNYERGADLLAQKELVASKYLFALAHPKVLFLSIDGSSYSNHKMRKMGYQKKDDRMVLPDAGEKKVITALAAATNRGKIYYMLHEKASDYRLMIHFFQLLFQELDFNGIQHVVVSLDNASWNHSANLKKYIPNVTLCFNVRATP